MSDKVSYPGTTVSYDKNCIRKETPRLPTSEELKAFASGALNTANNTSVTNNVAPSWALESIAASLILIAQHLDRIATKMEYDPKAEEIKDEEQLLVR